MHLSYLNFFSSRDEILESESEVTQSCPILCGPIVYSLPDFSIPGIFQARVPEWVAISFQGIFPTQGSNLDLPHCRQIPYYLSHQGNNQKLAFKLSGGMLACSFLLLVFSGKNKIRIRNPEA